MQIEFPGRKILVVGAAYDIGQSIVQSFAETGAHVHACDIKVDEVKKIAGPCGKGTITASYVDVTKEDSVAETVRAASEGSGIDVLVYLAGGSGGQVKTPVEEVTLAQWRIILEINVTGLFLFARAVVPIMKKAGKGRIVAITSRAGLGTSLTGIQAYCAAKHAQNGLVKQLGHDLAPFNITVNAVAPGFMCSSPDTRRQWNSYTPEFQNEMKSRLAGGRTGKPSDIASAALYLASDQAEWVTGQIMPVIGRPL